MSVGKWVLAMLFAATTAGSAFAQGELGRVSGIVRDQSNAFVAEAKVLVKNERTGDERSALTNNDGYFIIGSLRPSTYTIKVEKDGFAVIEYTGMPVATGQELALDFEIKPAGVQEAVTVVGTAPVLDVSSARIGANVSEREVQGLPVNGRQMSQLMLQAPGSQNAGDRHLAGRPLLRPRQRAERHQVRRHRGLRDHRRVARATSTARTNTPFKLQASLENVQEFRVESSSYTAEFGTGTGGQVSVITKSGGNRFHGAVFEYLRNDKLDAPNHFDSFAQPRRQRHCGRWRSRCSSRISSAARSAGRSSRTALFFFGSYEGYRLDAGKNFVEAVPSAAAWARAVPAVAGLRPGFLAPGAVLLPGRRPIADLDISQLQDTQKVKENSFSARFDFKMTQNWSAYFRVFHDQGTNDEPDGVSGRRLISRRIRRTRSSTCRGCSAEPPSTSSRSATTPRRAPTAASRPAGVRNFILNLGGTVANSGIAGQWGSPGSRLRAAWSASTARETARRSLRSVLADVRRFAEQGRRQPLPEIWRRRPR